MSSDALTSGYELHDYSIESVLGTGGFGITYLARDSKLGTRVAIKEYFPRDLARRNEQMTIVPMPGAAAGNFEWGRQQFLKEAQALAQFKHNNIVRVLRFLELNGTAYMIMEYEQGRGFLDYIQSKGQPDERMLLQVFLPILNGLQAVHRAGLLHLDIKPDNIYLRADGPPMLIDFGSARNVARGADTAGPTALTPAYAAIEQYPGKGKQGPWTDIYSIGASLYRCISGNDPVDALTRYQATKHHKPDPLTPATKLEQGSCSVYLRECIDWAMQVEPSRRPQGAVELQDALMGKGHPHRKPVQPVVASRAEPDTQHDDESSAPGAPLRLNLWRVTQVTVVALIVVLAVLVFYNYRDYSDRPKAAPVTASDDGKTATTAPVPGAADVRIQPKLPQRAAGATEEPVFYYANPIKLTRTINAHRNSVDTLALLAGGGQLASAGADGAIKIWDTQGGQLLRTLKAQRRGVNAIAVSPDGSLLVSAGNEGALFLWDPSSGKRLAMLTGHATDVFAVAYSPDGRWLASAGRDRTIILWDMSTRRPAKNFEGHEDSILTLAFSPKSDWLLSGGKDGQMKRWSVSTGKEIAAFVSHQGKPIASVAISPDGQWFASAGGDKQVRLWVAMTGQQKRSMTGSPGSVNALVFTPDSKQLVAGGSDYTLRIWDVLSGGADHDLTGHDGDVQAVVVSASDKIIASAGKDKTIRIWKVETR
jgi:WD40 repeat protein/serine/threonine protein kinase